jgi:putative ATPase
VKKQPLADRMRPENLDEYIGQKHIFGEGKLLRRAIEIDALRSIILYGPPGAGKTSAAKVISKMTKSIFVQLNATEASKGDVKDVIEQAKKAYIGQQLRTILFIDEIHRFNKGQQDTLLPAVEDGTVILVGATTENPFFEVNGALLSRSTIFKLESLTKEDIKEALIKALESPKGLKDYPVEMFDEALEHLADASNGDLRNAYNALELAVLTTPIGRTGTVCITLEVAEESIQQRMIQYDKGGSHHYDTMSAFIKSMRGGDATAALHYFARMITAGEDPKALARRIIIHASEDVGMANPQALQVAVAAFHALEICGITEGRIPLAEAIIFICESSKSNSVYNAINKAFEDVKNKPLGQVPNSLRDTHYKGAKDFGNGEGYIYPHNIPGGWTPQQYAPDNIHGSEYYKPSNNGFEVNVKKARQQKLERYQQWKDGFK